MASEQDDADDVESIHEASQTVFRLSAEETKSDLDIQKVQSEVVVKEGLRLLAEDISWQIEDEIRVEEAIPDTLADEEKTAEQILTEVVINIEEDGTIDEDGNIEEGEKVKEQETDEAHLIVDNTVDETAISKAASSVSAREITLPPSDAEFRGSQLVDALDFPTEQVPQMYSQTQLGTTELEEERQELNIEEIFFSRRRTFYNIEDQPRESRYEEPQDVELQMKKEDMLMKLHNAMLRQESLHWTSLGLQSKIADYYKKKKIEEKQDPEKAFLVNEETYRKQLAELRSVRDTVEQSIESHQEYCDSAKLRCQQKKQEVATERRKLLSLMQKVVQGALFSHTRKPIPSKDVEHYLTAIPSKEFEISKLRLCIIKLKNDMDKKKMLLRSKEELADGLRIQDFEQLKIENQTFNEKIEEKNEDMLKLKRKIASTVQILSHCKEKLQYVQHDNLRQVTSLKEVDISLAKSRSILAKAKQARDVLKAEHGKLLQESGLLGNKSLLHDFEDQQDQKAELSNKLQQVKYKHKRLTLRCADVQFKINEARKKMKKKEWAS